MVWPQPSERVRELMQQGAKAALNGSQRWLERLDAAALSSEYLKPLAKDPVFVDGVRQSNRANYLHWVAANVSRPGEPVAANLTVETLMVARIGTRHGLDGMAILDSYRLAQDAAFQAWIRTAFRLTSDVEELRELLDVSARSLAWFVQVMVTAISQQIRIERNELAQGNHAARRAVAAQLIEGVTPSRVDAEAQLGYRLGSHHTAAVVWADESDAGLSDLDGAAEVLMQCARRARPLSVLADAITRWVWLSDIDTLDPVRIAAAIEQLPGVRIAIGSTAPGIEGFRRSHLDALITQRIMMRLGCPQRVARFADIELTALVTADPEHAARFIEHTLGDLKLAEPELQQTLLTFISEQCNVSRAAAQLFIHRNTLLRRLDQARKLLPRPLEDTSVHIAVALEVMRWQTATI